MLTESRPFVSPEEVRFFHENGYLHLKGVIEPWEREILDRDSRRVIDFATDHAHSSDDFNYGRHPETGAPVLRRINRMFRRGDRFHALIGHPRLLATAEALLGRDFAFADDALVVKMPDYGVAVPWHRDVFEIPPKPCRIANVAVYLDAATPENGCLYVVPGSNTWPAVDVQELVDQHGFNIPGAIPVITEAGDVIIHNGNGVLHGSAVSRGGQHIRRVIYDAYITMDEMSKRGDEPFVRAWLAFLQRAIDLRASLPGTGHERPFVFNPTRAEHRTTPGHTGYVDLYLKTMQNR